MKAYRLYARKSKIFYIFPIATSFNYMNNKTRVLLQDLTCFIALVCAADPTRLTDKPTLMAGRIPLKNSSVSKKICPSVMEITFVGIYEDTSPACMKKNIMELIQKATQLDLQNNEKAMEYSGH
jgi:hypothetical protein